jgi:hypothetical protein
MADKKISALTAATTPLAGTEVLPIVQSGATVKVSISNVTAGRAVSASSLTASTGSFIVSTSGQGITTGSAIPLGLGTNNTLTAVTIDTSSNLLVGTTVADNKLTVSASSSGAAAGALSLVNPNDGVGTAADLDFVCHSSGTLATGRIRGLIAGADNYPMSFWTYGGGGIAERMRITAAGDVSVATGNLVIATTAKGVTTGSAIPLGLGVNNAVTAVTIDTSSNVGIGTTSPAATALLDVQSTTKGVRFPNMTTGEKAAITPSAGTVVFDTTLSKLCVYSGATWETITSV